MMAHHLVDTETLEVISNLLYRPPISDLLFSDEILALTKIGEALETTYDESNETVREFDGERLMAKQELIDILNEENWKEQTSYMGSDMVEQKVVICKICGRVIEYEKDGEMHPSQHNRDCLYRGLAVILGINSVL